MPSVAPRPPFLADLLEPVDRVPTPPSARTIASPKTVEANLTRIYGKLGVRSRAALVTRMVERKRAHTDET